MISTHYKDSYVLCPLHCPFSFFSNGVWWNNALEILFSFLSLFQRSSKQCYWEHKEDRWHVISLTHSPLVFESLATSSSIVMTILRYVCSLLITDTILGGAQYFSRSCIKSLWSIVLYDFIRSTNITYVGRLCCLRQWITYLRGKEPHWHNLLGVALNWCLVTCFSSGRTKTGATKKEHVTWK